MHDCLRGKIIFFVTNNIHKFNEVRLLADSFRISLAMLKKIKTFEIQDNSLENIARATAIDSSQKCHLPVLVEDAGLFIKAINGFPGPYSSYTYNTIGLRGILKLMKSLSNREAFFKSVFAYRAPGKEVFCFRGKVKGEITKKIYGTHGFGFDPIFKPNSYQETFAEMPMEEKNVLSHRALAFGRFLNWYRSENKSQKF